MRFFKEFSVRRWSHRVIHADRTISKDGKKFFPLLVYHALPEDFPLLASLGFNVLYNDFNLDRQAPGADILATDPYPVPNVPLRAVADATHSALRAVGGQKPVWTILPQYATKIPTRAELRCMAWLAIASGANGLGFFDWDERTQDPQTGTLQGWYAKEHPEQINDLRSVLGELRPLEHVLLAPQAAQQPAIEPANPALHALLKESAGKRYLILANDSRRAEQATLGFAGVTDAVARRIGKGGGSERLPIRNGELPLDMAPLGAAVYQLTPPCPRRSRRTKQAAARKAGR